MGKFGVAGYPPAFFKSKYKKNRSKIFSWLKDLGLDAFEAQMTYGPRSTKETCEEFNELSKEFGISISIHASYFIVLTSSDKDKVERSIDTLKRTFELADIMGAEKIILHPGPLYNQPASDCLSRIIDNLQIFYEQIGKTNIGLYLETAGKRGQLGSVEEIFKIVNNIKVCYPCVDFGHVHARTGGTLNNESGIDALFEEMRNFGAFEKDRKIHFHYTPINYGPKGEISHKALADRIGMDTSVQELFPNENTKDNLYHPRFERIVENLSKIELPFTVISEANNSQEVAATAMSDYYKTLQ